MTPQKIAGLFLEDIRAWYDSKRAKKTGALRTNTMTVGMLLIDHMARSFPLTEAAIRSKEEGQVKDLSGAKIAEILARYGETRELTREGGRTSRGSLPLARAFAEVLNDSDGARPYLDASPAEREFARSIVQDWIVKLLQEEYLNGQRLTADLDHRKPVKFAVKGLLDAASQRTGTVSGAVAQHLVGAKLSMRFPGQEISNESYTTADQQTERPGDFKVADTAIHVTMSPSHNLISNRCRANLRDRYRPLVLVPGDAVPKAVTLVEIAGLAGQVAVISIEDFVGQNIEEIGGFSDQGIKTGLKDLLEKYNERVQAVETDPALLIAIPENL